MSMYKLAALPLAIAPAVAAAAPFVHRAAPYVERAARAAQGAMSRGAHWLSDKAHYLSGKAPSQHVQRQAGTYSDLDTATNWVDGLRGKYRDFGEWTDQATQGVQGLYRKTRNAISGKGWHE